MTKTQEIEDLKKVLAEERAEHKRVWELWNEACARETARSFAAADAEVDAERAAAKEVENATVRQIESGLIPVDALRGIVRSEYDITPMRDGVTIEATLAFRGKDRVQSAIHKAIFGYGVTKPGGAKSEPKFTSGGFVIDPLPRYVDGGYVTRVVELSPADRQLLRDIRDRGVAS